MELRVEWALTRFREARIEERGVEEFRVPSNHHVVVFKFVTNGDGQLVVIYPATPSVPLIIEAHRIGLRDFAIHNAIKRATQYAAHESAEIRCLKVPSDYFQ